MTASLGHSEDSAAGASMTRPNWFLALPLPAGAGWQHSVATAPAGLRRFAPEDLHLTVAFLGACGEAAALQAWRAVECLRQPPIRIAAAGWRALGPPRQPSAYGVSLSEGHGVLVDLLAVWGGRALQAADQPPASRPPLPHVTLLRPRRREAPHWQGPMHAWMATAPLPPAAVRLEELALWTWSQDRSQRLFAPVCRRGLA
jgi:2'-5' RNA ligase